MKNVMRIDFETGCATSDGEFISGTERGVTVLFNRTVIDADEVREIIETGMYEYDDRIVVTTPTQANNLRTKKEN